MRSSTLVQAQESAGRLGRIFAEGLATLPNYAFELNQLLSEPEVDLREVIDKIRAQPGLSHQLHRLSKSALFDSSPGTRTLTDTVILLGAERLRTLVLTCWLMKFTTVRLPLPAAEAFWRHGMLTALLSERIARWTGPVNDERPYLAGLLHDMGQLGLCMIALEAHDGSAGPLPWQDNLALEREYFGLDHSEIGRWMGLAWGLPPWLIDVFAHHHHPANATSDRNLVGIIAAADHICQTNGFNAASLSGEQPREATVPDDEFLQICLPGLAPADQALLLEGLETEYLHLLPILDFATSFPAHQVFAPGVACS